MPVPEFDQRLNRIFQLSDEIEVARMTHDDRLRNDKLAEALAFSCLLLEEINKDSLITSANPDEGAWNVLDSWKRTGQLGDFLQKERELLNITKLKPAFAERIVAGLESTIEEIIVHRGQLPRRWQNALALLASDVCTQASLSAQVNKRQNLLKRGLVATSGAFVIVLNLVPPPIVDLPQPMRTLSTSTGVWMVDRAAGGLFDMWFDR